MEIIAYVIEAAHVQSNVRQLGDLSVQLNDGPNIIVGLSTNVMHVTVNEAV